MADLLAALNRNPLTSRIVKAIGLPNPVTLLRATGGYEALPFKGKNILFHQAKNSYAGVALLKAMTDGGGTPMELFPVEAGSEIDIFVVDATGCMNAAEGRILYEACQPVMRQIARNARVLVVAAWLEGRGDPVVAATARGIEGFTRSLGKELGKKGATANLAYVAQDAVSRLEGVVRFFCGSQTTYVSGQAVRVTASVVQPRALTYSSTLSGKVALVTGSARGIGTAVAERLAQEGAQVVCLDVPSAADVLHRMCTKIGAVPLMLDIAAPESPKQIAAFFRDRFGGLDVLVHNAGITRDRTLANMSDTEWDKVVAINFQAITELDRFLLDGSVLRHEGRIVCLSSISGIAGNFGQANYAFTKAALIGYVEAQALNLAPRGICINAVAPGFIETAMTDKMPFLTREIGRRLNSLQQGGRPRDAAELITFLATPGAFGISGNTIRVCGQGFIGA